MSDNTMTDLEAQADVSPATPPALELDAAKYLPELADFDMTEAQAQELLETLWSIMRSFVELGFSVNICEQIFENGVALPKGAPDDVQCPHSTAATENAPDGTEKEDS